MAAAIAIFDMDGTLTRGDTFLAYLRFVLGRRARRTGHCLGLPLAVAQFRCGLRSRDWLKQEFVRAILGGSTRTEIEIWTSEFAHWHGRKFLKPGTLDALRRHQTLGHRLMIASASVDIYRPALAALWGVPEVVCTKLEWQSDRLTGRLDGPNLRGEAKLAAVRERVEVSGSRPKIFAYSDDHSDLPLLRFADYGFAVDPTRKLAACAAREGLRIVSWKSINGTIAPALVGQTHPSTSSG